MAADIAERHQKLIVSDLPFSMLNNYEKQCPDCLTEFDAVPDMFNHMRQHHDISKQRYPSDDEVEIDFSSSESESGSDQSMFNCKLCGIQRKSNNVDAYKYYHNANWHKNGAYTCSHCDPKLTFKHEWQRACHAAERHAEFDHMFDCNKCTNRHQYYTTMDNERHKPIRYKCKRAK